MTSEEKKVFGEKIRELREKRSMSQEDFAYSIGKSRDNISSYEIGRSAPPADTLVKMADIFKVSTDYLLGRTDDPTPPVRPDEIPTADDIKRTKFLRDMEEILRQSSDLDDMMIAHSLRIMEVTFLERLGEAKRGKK